MILRNSAILAIFSVISLILGIFRDRLLVQFVGIGPMLDVYNAAFRIPDVVYGLLLAAVSAATVVPFITQAAHEDDTELASKFNSLFFFFGGSLIALSVFVALFVPYLAQYVVPGFDEYQRAYFVTCTRILLIQPFFLGLSALISSLAQIKHRFFIYSIAPLVYTAIIILSIPLLYPKFGIEGIIWGVVVGALLSFAVQSYTLYKERMKLSLSMFSWEHVLSHMRIAIPRSLSTVISRIRDLMFAAVATSFGAGVLSIYLFAQRIIDAFVQVVVQSAATATLPLLAHKHKNGEYKDYAKILKVNLIAIFSISVVAALIISVFKHEIVSLLYGANVERADEIARMAQFFAWSMPLYALNIYFVNAFSASKDTMGLLYANLIASSVGVLVLYSVADIYGTFALVVSSWVLSVVYLLLLVVFYSRKRRLSN